MTSRRDTRLIEEGAASIELAFAPGNARPTAPEGYTSLVGGRPTAPDDTRPEPFDVIVIGGGQAGLSVGYHLGLAGARFVILEAQQRVGDAWRKRWDSLRLFTPARFDGLDGMPFPAPRNSFPTKDEMADYLESYARQFRLPVRTGMRVERLFERGGRYVVRTGDLELEAGQVVIAMAKYQRARIPDFARSLSPGITQLHALDYRGPSQLQAGGVLLVGAGNSGADIALETARAGHHTWLAGRDVGQVPFRPESFLGRRILMPLLFRVIFRHVLTVNTPIGRKARQAVLTRGGVRIRVRSSDLAAAGVERAPRVVGVRDGKPLLEDGSTLAVGNIIWCTGFHAGFDWIDLPVLDGQGHPNHLDGVARGRRGLYFVGLPFLHSMSSSMIHGVGRDAARIVAAITTHCTPRHTLATRRPFSDRTNVEAESA